MDILTHPPSKVFQWFEGLPSSHAIREISPVKTMAINLNQNFAKSTLLCIFCGGLQLKGKQ